jgi:gas vesicle protein
MAYAGKAAQTRSRKRVGASRKSSGTIAVGVAVGLLVGAGLALLLAPKTGRDTRGMLARGLRRAGSRGRDVWEDLSLELRRARRQLRQARRLRQELAAEAVEAVEVLPGA